MVSIGEILKKDYRCASYWYGTTLEYGTHKELGAELYWNGIVYKHKTKKQAQAALIKHLRNKT